MAAALDVPGCSRACCRCTPVPPSLSPPALALRRRRVTGAVVLAALIPEQSHPGRSIARRDDGGARRLDVGTGHTA
jgi:hypothetical protein